MKVYFHHSSLTFISIFSSLCIFHLYSTVEGFFFFPLGNLTMPKGHRRFPSEIFQDSDQSRQFSSTHKEPPNRFWAHCIHMSRYANIDKHLRNPFYMKTETNTERTQTIGGILSCARRTF